MADTGYKTYNSELVNSYEKPWKIMHLYPLISQYHSVQMGIGPNCSCQKMKVYHSCMAQKRKKAL
ncbi:MAG: hypothetical protein ACP6IU_11750 [Candidatus Asgardarchaeia archaeon]